MRSFFLVIILMVLKIQSANGAMPTDNATTDFGTRSFSFFAPKGLRSNAPIIVALHGCYMTPEQMANGTQLNDYASKYGFAVIYPQQTYIDNSWACWNWFKPENLQRGGELEIVNEMVKKMKNKLSLSGDVYAIGISAGAAMVSNLLACYGDTFRGGLVHSGLEFHAAETEQEAHQVMKSGPKQNLKDSAELAFACSAKRKKLSSMIVVHGDSDHFVGKINADRVAEQFKYLNLLTADQLSLPTDFSSRKDTIPAQQAYGFSAQVTDYFIGDVLVVKKIIVNGMGHGWSGGLTASPYMEPRGININDILVDHWLKK